MTDKPLDCAGTTGPVGKHDFVDDRCRVCGAAFVVMGDRFLTGICSPECRDLSGEMRTAQELIEEELRNDPEFAEIHRRQMEIDAAPRPDIVRPGADSCAPVAPVVDGMPGEIWIGDIEGSHCRCWNGPTYGGFHGEGHISTKYVRADLVKAGAE